MRFLHRLHPPIAVALALSLATPACEDAASADGDIVDPDDVDLDGKSDDPAQAQEQLRMLLALFQWVMTSPELAQRDPLRDDQLQKLARTFPVRHADGSFAPNPDAELTEELRATILEFALYREGRPWTTWYESSETIAVLKLALTRALLDRNNLFHAYPEAAPTGHEVVSCTAAQLAVRQIDGRCNDPDDTLMGAAGTRLGRNVPLSLADMPSTQEILDPNPRTISRELLARPEGEMAPVPFLNLLAAAWIQFQVHDWVSHGDNRLEDTIDVPLRDDDPLKARIEMLAIQRTMADPTRTAADDDLPATYVNEVTHWWDASQVYGSDPELARSLRLDPHGDLVPGGKLYLDERGNLPVDDDGRERTGFRRNFWIGLSLLHTLFAREHNAIADMLAERHPDWSGDRIYDLARMVNAALIAKIHTVEWTPAILPNSTLETGMRANWWGLLRGMGIPKDTPGLPNEPVLHGLVGSPRDLEGVPFSITEEFTSVYRLHSLLPDEIEVVRVYEDDGVGEAYEEFIPTEDTRDEQAAELMARRDLEDYDWFYTFGKAHPGALVLNNIPRFLQDLVVPGVMAFDMGTTDIVRDRERGVPRYNEFRSAIGLKPITSFGDLTDDAELAAKIERIYDGDLDKLDLLVGCLAESHRPTNFGFGETIFQIFALMASRRLSADRFFTDAFNAETYTQEGLDWIEHNTMATVLLRHVEELEDRGLQPGDNAFERWADPR